MSPDTSHYPQGSLAYPSADRPTVSSSPPAPTPYFNGPRHLPQTRQPYGGLQFDPGGRVDEYYSEQQHHYSAGPRAGPPPPPTQQAGYRVDAPPLPPADQQQNSQQSASLPQSHHALPTTQFEHQPAMYPGPSNAQEFQRYLSTRYPQLQNMCDEHNEPYGLLVRQQPQRGLVAIPGKEKNRKPLDPPLFVEFRVPHHLDPFQLHLVNTGLFAFLQLWRADTDEPYNRASTGDFIGTIVSSIHKFKGPNDRDGAWMIWGDLSCCRVGRFRLKVTLMERHSESDQVTEVQSVMTDPFDVMQPKEFPGLDESTYLTRSFADQGAKVRIRKEPNRNRAGTKRPVPQDIMLPQHSPVRTQGFQLGYLHSDHPGSEDSPTKRIKHEGVNRSVSSPWPGHQTRPEVTNAYVGQTTAAAYPKEQQLGASLYSQAPSAAAQAPTHADSYGIAPGSVAPQPSQLQRSYEQAVTEAWTGENVIPTTAYATGAEALTYRAHANVPVSASHVGVNLNQYHFYNASTPPPSMPTQPSYPTTDSSPERPRSMPIGAPSQQQQ